MESIKIENFGPIKKADIQLGKLTVLIGEPASGKSTVAKLVGVMSEQEFLMDPNYSFFKNFGIEDFLSENSTIQYFNENYTSKVKNKKADCIFKKSFYNETAESYRAIHKDISDIHKKMSATNNGEEWKILLESLNVKAKASQSNLHLINGVFGFPVYFPTERLILSIISELTFSLNEKKINLPQLLNNFGAHYEEAKKTAREYESEVIDFSFRYSNGMSIIKMNGIELPLTNSASGIQTLVPLELVIEYLVSEKLHPENDDPEKYTYIIEEPELSLFPVQQKKLLEYLVSKSIQHGDKLIITTHSPYILTAINNLIEADNVIKKRPELKEEVNKIIPEHLQLAFEDVTAYFMNADGTSHSIMDEETRMIDAKAIDVASDEIVDVFDQLLNLEYQK